MNRIQIAIISLMVVSGICLAVLQYDPSETSVNRKEFLINDHWLFKTGSETGEYTKIDIPHTPKVEPLVVNDQWQGDMWYKKELEISDPSKKYQLEFGGVMHESKLWVNDRFVGEHHGGYLPFVLDISEHVEYGTPNEIKLQAKNTDNPEIPPGKPLKELDFNYYGGIYRSVKLIETSPLFISHSVGVDKIGGGGVLCHFSNVSRDKAELHLRATIQNDHHEDAKAHIVVNLEHEQGNVHSITSKAKKVMAGELQDFVVEAEIPNPLLWSVREPHLYELRVELYQGEKLVDQYKDRVGIRKIQLSHEGFFLNDEKLYIRGTNRHQEYPYVGYALSDKANYRDALQIKQAGFDFVRLSHYPQDEHFLDACDELGLLVMNAIPGWQFFGNEQFVEHSYDDIRRMVRRDRNHPSVVFWEVSLNESAMSDAYMLKANEVLKAELPFEDTYSAGWIDHSSFDLYIPARQHGKAPDYWNNYKTDNRPLFIAEYGDWEYYAQNAGFNQSAFNDLKAEERTSRQLRGNGEKALLQQALNFQEAANSNKKGPNTVGHANWLMFDYNRGYADDLEASGICDIFRIPKFAFYFYQSQRAADDTLALQSGTGPMVKIASHWTANSNPKVRVFSNCEEVALYLNDSLIDKSRPTIDQFSSHLEHPPFHFDLGRFVPGTLRAVAYIGGKVVAEDIVRTPNEPDDIQLEVRTLGVEVAKEEGDVLIVYAKVVDANGTLLVDSNAEITFKSAHNELIGQNPVKAEAGIASILVRTRGEDAIDVTASSDFAARYLQVSKVE